MLKRWLAIAAYRCEVAGIEKDIVDLQTRYFEFANEADIEPALVAMPPHTYTNEAGETVKWIFSRLLITWHYDREPTHGEEFGGVHVTAAEIASLATSKSKTRAELLAMMPRKKIDLESAQAVVDLGFPLVAPIIDEILIWLQDINRPVNRVFQPFLVSIGAPLAPYLRDILQSNDDIWKYWIVQDLIGKSPALIKVFGDELNRMANQPTVGETKEEVHLVAQAVLQANVEMPQPQSNAPKRYRFFKTNEPTASMIAGCLAENEIEQRKQGLLPPNATLLWEISAFTYEEAMAVHNLRIGFGPYNPTGESVACPTCEAHYYPLGSGECWHCGKIC